MMTSHLVALLFSGAIVFPAAAEQEVKTAPQTVVVPSLPGERNREIRIGGEEIAGAEMTGPEVPFTAQVVQWEEGRSITIRLPDGQTRVVPVASSVLFPPDLRPGGAVTILTRQTADGTYRVTGLRTGTLAERPAAPATAPAVPATTAVVPFSATVSTPPVSSQPGAPARRGKTFVGASFLKISGTVKSLEKGRSITIVDSSGRERTLPLAEGARVPDGLTAGDKVTARVPLQKPFDGKTADRVEKRKPKKTPPLSKIRDAQTPRN